jgi:hypothetical protein
VHLMITSVSIFPISPAEATNRSRSPGLLLHQHSERGTWTAATRSGEPARLLAMELLRTVTLATI